MAKANNCGRTKKSQNYKPYDSSNSFVKRITAKVSEILPQPSSWVSRLFSPAPKLNVREREDLEEDDDEEEERQPPSKRLCFGPSEASDYSHQNNINRFSEQGRESGEISPILSSQLDDDRARPGPSGLHLRKFVSSTPAVRPQAAESSPRSAPSLMKKTSVSELKKTVRRSSLNLSSSSTLNTSTQPSFDTFVFKNPLNKRPRTSLNESCFYPGETTYGGASARVSLPIEQPKARVVNVTASPSLQRDTIGTSALRILKALEQFSTPVLDAKKIPIRTEGSNPRKRKPPQPYEELIFPTMPELLSLKRREVVSKPYGATETGEQPTPSSAEPSVIASTTAHDSPIPPVSKPNAYAPSTSVAEYSIRPESSREASIGSIKRRQKDEDLEMERVPELNLPNVHLKLTSLPKFDLGTPASSSKALPSINKPENSSNTSPKFKFSEPEVLYSVSTGKMASGFHVNNFKFSEPLDSLHLKQKTPSGTPNSKQKSPSVTPNSNQKTSITPNSNKKTHSSTTNSNQRTPSSTQSSNQKIPSESPRSYSKETSSLKMKGPSPNFKLKRKSVESITAAEAVSGFKLGTPGIKSGNIADIFGKSPKTDSKMNYSEAISKCSKCMKNIDKIKGKCSCENSTESSKVLDKNTETNKVQNDKLDKNQHSHSDQLKEQPKAPLKSFEGYKKPVDTWECKECFVRNKNSCDTCVSCSSAKDGKSSVANTMTTSASSFKFSSGENKKSPSTKTASSFMPLMNSIKKPHGTWECNTCLVQNKEDVTSCVACSTPKPGTEAPEKPKPTFSFGIPSSSETKNFQFGIDTNAQKKDPVNEKPNQFTFISSNDNNKAPVFKFGNDHNNETVTKTNVTFPPMTNSYQKSEDKWECDTCLVQNKKDVNNCVACNTARPGSKALDKPKPTFSFGVPNTSISPVNSVQFTSNLNSEKSENVSEQPHFTFGSKLEEKKTGAPATSLFKFGSDETKINLENKPSFNFMNSDKSKENEISKPTSSTLFTFGNTSEENKIDASSLKDGIPPKKKVSFGTPLVSEKSITNDNHSTIFGSALTSKSNDIGSSNFTFSTSSPFQNNSIAPKESTKEPVMNAFTFGKTDSNANLKPLSEPTKPIGFNSAPTDMTKLSNNEHPNPNTHNIFGGPFTGFKPAESENKPFSILGNSQGSHGGQFTFNTTASGSAEVFGGNQQQQPTSGVPLFGQQQQQQQTSSAPSLFSQPTENKPFVFGAPPQQQSSVFTFSGTPQQSAGIGGSAPPFGGGFTSPPVNSTTVFDPNVKPLFNFTGGAAAPSFSAPAISNSSVDLEKRKVRKAIRRTQHR